MKKLLLLLGLIVSFYPPMWAQLTMPWSPVARYRVFVTDTNSLGIRFIDGYRLQPGGIRRGQDSLWVPMPVSGTESAYHLCISTSPGTGTYVDCMPSLSVIGDTVRWIESKQCFRLMMPTFCNPGHCFVSDSLYFFPHARVGQVGAVRTSNPYGIYGGGTTRTSFKVLSAFWGTVGSITDSIRVVGDSAGTSRWHISKNHGIVETNKLFEWNRVRRRAIHDSLWQRLPLLGATSWMDIRPGDVFDYKCYSTVSGRYGSSTSVTPSHQVVSSVEWAADSSQVTINYLEMILPARLDSSAYRDTLSKQVVLRKQDFLFADRQNFVPFSKGYSLFQKRNGPFYWGYTGSASGNEYFPGYWNKTWMRTSSAGYWGSSEWGCTVLYVHSQRFGDTGTPTYQLVTGLPLSLPTILATPNPAGDRVRVTGATGAHYGLVGVSGSRLAEGVLDTEGIVERRGLPPGLYTLLLVLPNGQHMSLRVAFE